MVCLLNKLTVGSPGRFEGSGRNRRSTTRRRRLARISSRRGTRPGLRGHRGPRFGDSSPPERSPRPRPPPASRRRPPAGPEPPPGQLGSLGAGGATYTQLASRPLEPAPTSSRTHSRPPGARGASGGGSTSWPTSTARTLSRRRQAARSPSGGEELHGARETPVAALHPRRHQLARAARPDPAHPARHRAPLRRLQGPRRRAHEDLRGRGDRQPTDPARKKLLQQLRKHRQRGAFRGEEERRARLVAEFQKARLTGVRFKVPAETMSAQLANLPERGFGGARPDRGAVRRGGERPGAAVLAGPGARERLRTVRGTRW